MRLHIEVQYHGQTVLQKIILPRAQRILEKITVAEPDYVDELHYWTPERPRALTAQELAKYLASFGKPVTACDTVAEGVRLAIDHAGKDGTVLCYGSLYLLGDVIAAVEETK